MIKKDLETLNNYYDIGYFNIWELSNGMATIACNISTDKIVSL